MNVVKKALNFGLAAALALASAAHAQSYQVRIIAKGVQAPVGTEPSGPVAAYSTTYGSTITPSAAYKGMGTNPVGTTTNKAVILRNGGTDGALSVGFSLSGDTSQFSIVRVRTASDGGVLDYCLDGGVIASDSLSTTPCLAPDASANIQKHIQLIVMYQRKSVGTHIITVTPVSNNGTLLPGSITLTGTTQ